MRTKELVLLCFIFFTTASYAADSAMPQRGTQGLLPFAIKIKNSGVSPLDCQVTTAHWYSVALGLVDNGRTLVAPLWKNPASGEVIILNSHQDRMPLQRFWCGVAGQSWQTRYEVSLPNQRDIRPHDILLDCANHGGTVHCHAA
jgi:hypothetical protein